MNSAGFIVKKFPQNWRDGLVVRAACPFRGLEFNSQQPCQAQLLIIPAAGGSNSSCLCGHSPHVHIPTHRYITIIKNNKNNSFIKVKIQMTDK